MIPTTFEAAEKTPAQGPFAMRLERIEGKVDAGLLEAREERVAARRERKEALERANAAYQKAIAAIWMRTSWGPYLVSTLAAIAAVAALATACSH